MGQHQLGNFLVLRVGNSVFIFITWFKFFWKKKKKKKKKEGGVLVGSGILLFSIEC